MIFSCQAGLVIRQIYPKMANTGTTRTLFYRFFLLSAIFGLNFTSIILIYQFNIIFLMQQTMLRLAVLPAGTKKTFPRGSKPEPDKLTSFTKTQQGIITIFLFSCKQDDWQGDRQSNGHLSLSKTPEKNDCITFKKL